MAELTVVEIASALAGHYRAADISIKEFDELDMAFFRDLGAERLRVVDQSRDILRRARHLVRFAGVVLRRSLQSSDAIIAATCLDFALRRGERVVFYTQDRKLYNVLCALSAFKSALILRRI